MSWISGEWKFGKAKIIPDKKWNALLKIWGAFN